MSKVGLFLLGKDRAVGKCRAAGLSKDRAVRVGQG